MMQEAFYIVANAWLAMAVVLSADPWKCLICGLLSTLYALLGLLWTRNGH